ncbi:hypothetical protein M231_00981 [Tremella mesenterica]|uniref:Ricin B lectin domain-containing protein n=1 Tax=Tremella mesenterica TaxID=5217 RepID=A0A4Q1BUS0_TREME|nr:uncharacterized protein TREMEDRAFT_73633 [Tremella mesenterica DSM 1558]EIW69846.1 hypothetical protein TREMEDRAFT_73633 [Tremella mesenterica DSM 1558]RXK41746.1 hypothetical protein M231_00981 [Tremella mesenterica]
MSIFATLAALSLSLSFSVLPVIAQNVTSYAISPAPFTDLCVAPSSSSEGAQLVLTNCNDDLVAWTYSAGSLVNTATNMCLDLTDGGAWSGNKLQVWGCYSWNPNQQWDLSGENIKWDGQNLCMDLTDGDGSDGTVLQVWQCYDGNSNQEWVFTEIEEVGDDDECVTASPSGPTATASTASSSTASPSFIADAVNATDLLATPTASATADSASDTTSVIGGELWGNGGGNNHTSSSSASDSWNTGGSSDSWGSSTSASWASATASATFTSSSASSSSTSSSSGSVSNSGILQTSGTKIVDPSGNEVVLRGVNIGGWLVLEDWMCGINDNSGSGDRFAQDTLENRFGVDATAALIETWQDNYMVESDFDNIAAMGFNVMRMPFSYRTVQWANGSWRDDAFTKMDWAIAQGKKRGIYCIPTFHIWDSQKDDYSLISEDSDGGQSSRDAAGEIWKKVAAHWMGETAIAAYDAINEPTGSAGDKLQQDLYNAIRSVDANRIIIMESISTDPSTYGWTQVVYSMHEYLMMTDDVGANQAAWSGAQGDIDTWNGYQIPTYIGEFMAHEDTLPYMLDQLNNNRVSWSFWSYKSVNMGGWSVYIFPANPVDVSNDDYNSIMNAWSNFGTPTQNSDIYQTYVNAAGGNANLKKREERFVKVSQRAGAESARRSWGSHRRAGRFSSHGRSK